MIINIYRDDLYWPLGDVESTNKLNKVIRTFSFLNDDQRKKIGDTLEFLNEEEKIPSSTLMLDDIKVDFIRDTFDFYKIVKLHHGKFVSMVVASLAYQQIYRLNRWTHAPYNTKLFGFDNYNEAYKHYSAISNGHDYFILACETKGEIERIYQCHFSYPEPNIIDLFWNVKYPRQREMWAEATPYNTDFYACLVDSIKPIMILNGCK